MKLLLDQNLSRFLIAGLDRCFVGSVHVGEIGLASVFGPPPKVIWLRVGNASTDVIGELLTIHVDRVMEFGRTSDDALLVVDPTQPLT